MLKSLVRSVLLLAIGAGVGIWYAPPHAKASMQQGLVVAQVKAKDFHDRVGSKWIHNAERTLDGASKRVDLKKLNRKEFDQWVSSVKRAYTNFSEQADRTQKSVAAVNQYLQTAKNEYRKAQEKLPGI